MFEISLFLTYKYSKTTFKNKVQLWSSFENDEKYLNKKNIQAYYDKKK